VAGSPSAAVDVAHLTKTYRSRRRGDVRAVDDVSFTVAPGEIVGLLGPNGAGKTTTIKSIATLVRPSGGAISVCGVDAIASPRRAVRHVGAILEGNRNVYWRLSVKDNLEFFAEIQGTPARRVRGEIAALLERFDLADKRDTPARMLSKGMQQKLALACVFIKHTPLLLLDEPTLGLDVEASYELRNLIRELAVADGRTILLSTHDMAVVQDVCERVVIISSGRVVADDRVANLLQLFQARAYSFTLAGDLDASLSDAIVARFPSAKIKTGRGETLIETEFARAEDLYELIDLLRARGASLESIDRTDINFEEVFLRIVREARTP
jgi:ABC-2 type transport system ATP-binding protein